MGSGDSRIFFTIGYEGLGIKKFLEILEANGVKTLADSRDNPSSMNHDFSKKRLTSHLDKLGIRYVHLKEYGIPSEIRKTGDPIEWYIQKVKPKIQPSIIDGFDQPMCFMCMEKDIDHCHRKVILETLNQLGLKGKDLYSASI